MSFSELWTPLSDGGFTKPKRWTKYR